jgi:hypothetical protein
MRRAVTDVRADQSDGRCCSGRTRRFAARSLGLQLAAVAFGLAGIASGSSAQVPLRFPGQVPVRISGDNRDVLGFDHDGDGSEELVVGVAEGALVLVRFRSGGAFEILERFQIGGDVVGLARLARAPNETSLVAVTANPDEVVLLDLEAGETPFVVRARIGLIEDPGGVAVGRLGDDGTAGIAITLPGVDQLALIREDGESWRVDQLLATGDHPIAVALLDLDDDGVLEVVTADSGPLSAALSVFRWSATAKYELADQPAGIGVPQALFTYDEDADGALELFASYTDSAFVSVFEPVAGGLVEAERIPTPRAADGILVAPVFPDELALLCWNAERGAVHYYLRLSEGWSRIETFYTGGRASGAALADVNDDGFTDLMVANGTSQTSAVLFGNNLPSFRGYPAALLSGQPTTGAIVDTDGDGLPDLAVADFDHATVSVLHGTEDGSFVPAPTPLVLEAGVGELVPLHADGDDRTDLAALQPFVDRVRILLLQPDGSYVDHTSFAAGDSPAAGVAGDIDGDGFTDLVVLNSTSDDLTLAFGTGDGEFPTVMTLPVTGNVVDVALLDLDQNGLLDIAVSNGSSGLQTFANLGERLFGQVRFYALGGGASDIAAGDFDADGDLDLAVAGTVAQRLSFLENLGDGRLFVQAPSEPLDAAPGMLAAVDLNLSGAVDIVVSFPDAREIGVVANAGDWVFASPRRFQPAQRPGDIVYGDFNDDTVPDLVVLDRALDLAVTLLNIEPNPVPVEEGPLAARCRTGLLEAELAVVGEADWRLEIAGRGGWTELGGADVRRWGTWERTPLGWRLQIAPAELAAFEPSLAEAAEVTLRLLRGPGAGTVSALVSVPVCWPVAASAPLVELERPIPNPFNPAVALSFRIARSTAVEVAVWDLRGRRVATLLDRELAAGEHRVVWRGRGNDGPAPAGVYLVTVAAGDQRAVRKVVLVR